MAPPKVASTRPAFIKLGGDVLVLSKGQWYAGRIVQENHENREGRQGILIHYKGWGKRHDEAVYEDEFETRIKESTPESFAEAVTRDRVNRHRDKSKRKFLKPKEEQPSVDNSVNGDESDAASASRVRPAKRDAPNELPAKEEPKSNAEIVLPKSLRKILVDDHDHVNRQFRLCRLPAKETVAKIIADFIQEVKDQGDEKILIEYDDDQRVEYTATELIQNAKGTKDYFDRFLPFQLLYKLEKPRYEQLKKKLLLEKIGVQNPEATTSTRGASRRKAAQPPIPAGFKFSAAEYYGFPHLLRLLDRFEVYLKENHLHPAAVNSAIKTTCDMLIYLNKRRETLMESVEYENTTAEYQKEALSL